jgi:hypothetical protein
MRHASHITRDAAMESRRRVLVMAVLVRGVASALALAVSFG